MTRKPRNLVRAALATAALLVPVNAAMATVIVALVSSDRIVIAADSRATGLDGSISDSACKVHWNGEVAFTTSGHVYSNGSYGIETIRNDIFSSRGAADDRLRYAVSRLPLEIGQAS